MLTHSPAAMLVAPAMAPAIPARRTTDGATPAPAKPMTNETLETSPSLTPNTAARARPPATERCPGCDSARRKERRLMLQTLPTSVAWQGNCRQRCREIHDHDQHCR